MGRIGRTKLTLNLRSEDQKRCQGLGRGYVNKKKILINVITYSKFLQLKLMILLTFYYYKNVTLCRCEKVTQKAWWTWIKQSMEKTQSRMIPKVLVRDRPRSILEINQLSQLSDEVALGPRSHRNSQETESGMEQGWLNHSVSYCCNSPTLKSPCPTPQPPPQY